MDWYWSWNSNTLNTWCKEMIHWKRPWCWERLKVGGEGDNRGWDGWMVSPIQWTWVWVSSRRWWCTGRPGMLQSMGSQRFRHDWAIELNWKCMYLNRNISNIALLTHCSNIHCTNKFSLWKFYLLMWNEQNCSSNKWPLFSVNFIVRSAKNSHLSAGFVLCSNTEAVFH